MDLNKNKRLLKLSKCMEELKLFPYSHVQGFDLDCLPQGMGRLEKLNNNKRLVKVQECIEKMKPLKSLDVGGWDLDCLPQGMG